MIKPKFIAISTQKGGAGKTTMTVLLASHLHYQCGYNVAIIDCDYPQHSIAEMRTRDTDMILNDDFYKLAAYNLFQKINKKAYPVVEATFDTALQIAEQLIDTSEVDIDYIFFDLPGTVNIKGLVNVLSAMNHIFTPITADRVVLESSLRFASIVNESMLTTGNTKLKSIYMIWNMVDRREKSDLYDLYEKVVYELGIPIMNTSIPDSKRFRRELSQLHKPVFRSTLFPIDRSLIKSSRIDEVAKEFIQITNQL